MQGMRKNRGAGRSLVLAFAGGVLLAGTAGPAAAQQGPPEGRGMPAAEDRVERLTERLELTETQAAEVRTLFERQAAARRAAFEKHGSDRRAMRQEMERIREGTQARLGEILTERQRERLRTMRQDETRRPDGAPRRDGAGRNDAAQRPGRPGREGTRGRRPGA
ncbi:MAG: hypothetical protein RRA92_05345 [Gemmatimonadota bacterium]|nr:hypothetical protein [Gemmatimonadota bacterium]